MTKFTMLTPDGLSHEITAVNFQPDALSREPGNYLRFGNDNGVYADGNDILSNEADNALGISPVDGKIYYAGGGGTGGIGGDINIADYVDAGTCNRLNVIEDKLAVTAADMVSPEAGNQLQVLDCQLFVPAVGTADVLEVSCPYLWATGGIFTWTGTSPLGAKPTILQVQEAATGKVIHADVTFDKISAAYTIKMDENLIGANAIEAGAFTLNLI